MNKRDELIRALINEGYLKSPNIIEAFRAIDRADFVPAEYRSEAYGNYPLSIGEGQTISQPLTVAFMLEQLDPRPGEKILDIGAGSGWTTALLAHIVSQQSGNNQLLVTSSSGLVFGIERIPEICEFGKKNLEKYFDESRAKIICGDGTLGLPKEAPFDPAPFVDKYTAGAKRQSTKGAGFDKILAGATASREIPKAWRDQLKIGGKIVAPVGNSIWLYIKKSEDEWQEKEYPGFAFVPLVKNDHKHNKFFVFSALAFLTAGLILASEIYFPRVSYAGTKKIEITQGLGSRQIAELLKQEGVIRSKWVFVTYVSARGIASRLKPGKYAFSKISVARLGRDLARGSNFERAITIPEGWNNREIQAYFAKEGLGQGVSLAELDGNEGLKKFSDKFTFLREVPSSGGLEGYLFPDTYRIFQDADTEKIIGRMLENFDKKISPELRQEITRQKKTIFEIVTMASLIEKEVVSDEDRALVSGVLWRRLDLGIGLQVDATIAYITGKKTTKIPAGDLQIDSPYNTYKYRGLPIGPVSNPGLSAIKAAIYPQKSPYLYYLSAPDGRTIFSRTLEEHNTAKAKYLR